MALSSAKEIPCGPPRSINEVFLKLVDVQNVRWQDRPHFIAICANIMRRILIDRVRAKSMDSERTPLHTLTLTTLPN